MIGGDRGTNRVTSSRRHASAFGIDALLGLSRRDVIVTSFTPATVSSAEGQHQSSADNRGTAPCCCLVDVEDWTYTSPDTFRERFGLSTSSSNYSSANTDASPAYEQHRPGIKHLSTIIREARFPLPELTARVNGPS